MKKAANFRGKNFFLAHGTADGEISVFNSPLYWYNLVFILELLRIKC